MTRNEASQSKKHQEAYEANQEAKKRKIYNDHHQAVTKWLSENPHIGWLNGGKYYKIVDGNSVPVEEFGQ